MFHQEHGIVRLVVLFFFLAIIQQSVLAVTIETVPVGEPGNANDPVTGSLYGGVGHAYRIGKYEVTVGQYTEFLNAIAATDSYGLYSSLMAIDLHVAGIARSGASGSFSYSVIGSPKRPVTYVSWGDAARFANWLHNGQPKGTQNATTTEDGAYTLNGATSAAALSSVSRKPNAQWFIPTESEWYKAAYYESPGYWGYPMRTNSIPYSDQPPGATPDSTRVGNFNRNDGLANGYDDGYAMTGSTIINNNQNYLTDVGAYTLSSSHYGTFDQGGNVLEWNEAHVFSTQLGVRGGSWFGVSVGLHAARRGGFSPTLEYSFIGLRVASIPEPSTLFLVASVALVLFSYRTRRLCHE